MQLLAAFQSGQSYASGLKYVLYNSVLQTRRLRQKPQRQSNNTMGSSQCLQESTCQLMWMLEYIVMMSLYSMMFVSASSCVKELWEHSLKIQFDASKHRDFEACVICYCLVLLCLLSVSTWPNSATTSTMAVAAIFRNWRTRMFVHLFRKFCCWSVCTLSLDCYSCAMSTVKIRGRRSADI